MSQYLTAIDGVGNIIEGQVGNRTPIPYQLPAEAYRACTRRRLDRQGGLLANADASGFPVIPVQLRRSSRPANLWRAPVNPASQIRRYYQSFDVSLAVVVAAPAPRYRVAPYVPVPSSIANQIRRYYAPQLFDFAPVDHWRPMPRSATISLIPFNIRRYYGSQIIDSVPGDVTVTLGGSMVLSRFTTTGIVDVTLSSA